MKYFAKAGKFGPDGLYATLLETHTGKTEARYSADARLFLFGQKHPRFQVPYAETVYLPMLVKDPTSGNVYYTTKIKDERGP